MAPDARRQHVTRQLNAVDFIINSNAMSESLVLLSAMWRIPILYLVPVEWDKVRTYSADTSTTQKSLANPNPTHNNNTTKEDTRSCTTQWLDQLLPASQRTPCNVSCAGLWGLQSLTEDEHHIMERYNREDVDLWQNYVLPHYQSTRQSIMNKYQIGEDELAATVELYEQLQGRVKTMLLA